MVALGGPTPVSGREDDSDHRRCGGKQRLEAAAMEAGTAEVCRPDRDGYRSVPFSSEHQQMEQDRAPAVLVHILQLARGAFAGLRDDSQSHRRDYDGEGVESNLTTGSAKVPHRTRSKR